MDIKYGGKVDLLNALCSPGNVLEPTSMMPQFNISDVADTVAPQRHSLSSSTLILTLIVLLGVLLLLPVILIVAWACKQHKHR